MRLRSLVSILAISAAGCAMADQALVVGINDYPELPTADQLHGCVNDANDVAALLKGMGFEATVLTDKSATHDGIIAALKWLKETSKPGERVVVFFASHGSHNSNGQSVILTSDTSGENDSHNITKDELFEAVSAIPASTRTIVLDTCFSGGMVREKGFNTPIPGLRSRYYMPQENSKQIIEQPAALRDDAPDPKIAYFTACTGGEVARETDTPDGSHGLFSYNLVQDLKTSIIKNLAWVDLKNRVASAVSGATQDEQHPTLSAAFDMQPIFGSIGNGEAPQAGPSAATLWDLYSGDHADPSLLEITMSPNVSSLRVMAHFRFQLPISKPGYLVVIERDTAGELDLVWPRTPSADSAYVSGNMDLPDDGQDYGADSPGTERIKAIMFFDRAKAQSLLDNFGDGKPFTIIGMKSRSMPNALIPGHDYVTAGVTFEVVPG